MQSRARPAALAAAALLALARGAAAEAQPADLPADPRGDWRVGFTALRAVHLAAEDSYLGRAIPRLLQERLTPIRRHRLAPDEQLGRARRVLAEAVGAQRRSVVELQRQRDRQALARADTASLDEQLAAARERLRELRELAPEELEIAAHKPLAMAPAGSDEPRLPAPRFAPLQAARDADLDLLVTGVLEAVEGVLFLRLEALDDNLGRPLLTYRGVVRREAVADTLEELERQLAPLLTGEPWGALAVHPTPAQSAVYVDGALAGRGATEVPYLPLGEYTIRVTAPRHEPLERTVTLAGSAATVAPVLEPLPPQPVTIVSEPSGAALYLDSRYLGTTPLQVTAAARPARGLLRLAGYRDAAFVLRPAAAGAPLRFDLALDEYDLAQRQREQRDRFYDRFGAAVVSLAGPLILFTAAGEAGQPGSARPAAGAEHGLLIGGGFASLALTGALLVRAGVALGDYLGAAGEGAR